MRRLGSTIVLASMLTATTAAHHSPAAFDLNSQITIQGKVGRLEWSNPHVYIYVDSDSGTGKPAQWMIETDPVPILTRSGWRREQVAVGSTVTVRANPDRNPQRTHALLVSIAVGNGVVLTPRAPAAPLTVKATSIAGIWNGLRGFTQKRVGTLKPTAKGLAAMKAYTEGANPITNCVPYASPFLPTLPYLSEIAVQKDRVIIRSEFLNIDRTVWTDRRPHPADGPRTNQGHSTGRWEGDVLVVDTTLFTDHLLGNYTGSGGGMPRELPSGPRKHVVERYQLSEDKTRLLVSEVVDDPDYLEAPLTVNTEWDYAPQQRLLRFGCDRENAQRYLFK
jgi:hypothetical protein